METVDDNIPPLCLSDGYGNHIIAVDPVKIKLLIAEYPEHKSVKHYLKEISKITNHGNS